MVYLQTLWRKWPRDIPILVKYNNDHYAVQGHLRSFKVIFAIIEKPVCDLREHEHSWTALFTRYGGLIRIPIPLLQVPTDNIWVYVCLEVRGEIIRTVLCCINEALCTVISTLRWVVLTVPWIGFCHTGRISLCVDSFVFVFVFCVFLFYTT